MVTGYFCSFFGKKIRKLFTTCYTNIRLCARTLLAGGSFGFLFLFGLRCFCRWGVIRGCSSRCFFLLRFCGKFLQPLQPDPWKRRLTPPPPGWGVVVRDLRRVDNLPMGLRIATLVARPRIGHAKGMLCRLVSPHWVRDPLDSVATVALVRERVLHPKRARFAAPLVNKHLVFLPAEQASPHPDPLHHPVQTAAPYAVQHK